MIVRYKQTVIEGVIHPSEILFEGLVPDCFKYIQENWIDELHMLEVAPNMDEDQDYRIAEYWKSHHRLNLGRFSAKELAPSSWMPVIGKQEFVIIL